MKSGEELHLDSIANLFQLQNTLSAKWHLFQINLHTSHTKVIGNILKFNYLQIP